MKWNSWPNICAVIFDTHTAHALTHQKLHKPIFTTDNNISIYPSRHETYPFSSFEMNIYLSIGILYNLIEIDVRCRVQMSAKI